MHRTWKRLHAMAAGGTVLGVAQAFGLVDFASVFTNFLSALFAAIVQLLLGGTLIGSQF